MMTKEKKLKLFVFTRNSHAQNEIAKTKISQTLGCCWMDRLMRTVALMSGWLAFYMFAKQTVSQGKSIALKETAQNFLTTPVNICHFFCVLFYHLSSC